MTVKAVDSGEPSLEGVCSFTVEITDVNDNPPLFDRQVCFKAKLYKLHKLSKQISISLSDFNSNRFSTFETGLHRIPLFFSRIFLKTLSVCTCRTQSQTWNPQRTARFSMRLPERWERKPFGISVESSQVLH